MCLTTRVSAGLFLVFAWFAASGCAGPGGTPAYFDTSLLYGRPSQPPVYQMPAWAGATTNTMGTAASQSGGYAPSQAQQGMAEVKRRVAVMPFVNNSADPDAGLRISRKIAAALTGSGVYDAYTRENLADVLQEHELMDLGFINDEFTQSAGGLRSVDFIITGACNRFEVEAREELRRRGPWIKLNAFVDCSVNVIKPGTGHQVASFYRQAHDFSQGSPPRSTPEMLLRRAEDQVVQQVLSELLGGGQGKRP